MTRDEMVSFIQQLGIEEIDLLKRKNADYTGDDPDPFRNFRMFGPYGILVRMSDKLARLRTFAERGQFMIEEEGVRDTGKDLRNYAGLFLAMVSEKKS
jgi:hypothetical protein